MTTKEEMKEVIRQVGEVSLDYIGNVLLFMDVFWDTMNKKLEKMNKKELKELYEKAIKDKYYITKQNENKK